MENQKTKIISIVALVALALTVVTATYAYFQAQTGEGSQTDIKINANTVDTFTFETGSSISLSLNQTSFASGKGNITGNTYASAKLTANNKTNSATNNYNLYLNISDNNFSYTQSTSYPEILLTIKDASNNEITSISGLEYKTVTDGKGTTIKGFDITTKTGLITLLSNREITTTSTKTDTWNITATFVNYNADQSKNAGKSFSGQVLISKDSFDDYTPNTINTLSATKSGTNLTVNLNVEQGSNEIDKYYYAIEESNGIAMLNNNANKVQRLSNKLAANTLTYVESTSSSHTFTNLSTAKNYKISAYLIDKKKLKSNTYEYNFYSDSYVYPVINKVETTATSSSVTAVVTATKGRNNISKYYYSIDGGNTFVESDSNSYKFSSLSNHSNYKMIVKVSDSNNKYSNIFIKSILINFNTFAFYLDDVEFQADNDMTWEEWLNSNYSDNWSYKSKIHPFTYYYEKKAWGYLGNCTAYMPMCLGEIVIDSIFHSENNGALAIATSNTLYSDGWIDNIHRESDSCEKRGNDSNCYTTKVNIIKRQNKILNTLNNINEYAKTLTNPSIPASDITDNQYYIMGFWFSCLTPDTLIDVEEVDENGKKKRKRKKLKDIKVGDKVICINPFTLELDTDTVIECDGSMNKKHTCYDNWYFSDGTIITTVHRHRFFNIENKKFMYMEEWKIGEHGINIDNEKVELIKHEHVEEEINHCTLFTEKYNNYFANGMLSGNRRSKKIKL